ncbi:MAG: diguanylate cyclase [Anaerolineae bacterium]|nr:diguanylate cyclase [Anaerolineae bacterium]MDW8071932.1 diguanylate cyclase [Anaerolineae bacterium]
MTEKARVLVVDDDPDMVRLLKYALCKDGYHVAVATNGADALRQALELRPQVVITDLMMPGIDGTALCRELKSNPDLHPVYVIILTARDERESYVANLESGADDYIVKPAALHELRARIEVGLRWVRSQMQLHRIATSDSLTSLPNRYMLDEVLAREVAVAVRSGEPLSVIWLDLDHFKQVNDRFGHAVGDRALQALADLLRAQVRATDIPARYGGEEFVIVLPGVERTAAWAVAQRLRQVIAASLWPCVIRSLADTPLVSAFEEIRALTASLGVASLDQVSEKTASALLQAADAAVYKAKQAGRNRVCVYQEEGNAQTPEQLTGDDHLFATREIEVIRLYEAIARLGPSVSFQDAGTLAQMRAVLDANAVGWVCWGEASTPELRGCLGISVETAGQLLPRLQWTSLTQTSDLMSHNLPITLLADFPPERDAERLVMAVGVLAHDSRGGTRGGIWVAWRQKTRITMRHKFILGYLARILGLELELEAARQTV